MGRKITGLTLMAFLILILSGPNGFTAVDPLEAPGLKLAKQAVKSDKHWTTTDHSKIKTLDQEFTSGSQITEACLSCHTDASMQFEKNHPLDLESGL